MRESTKKTINQKVRAGVAGAVPCRDVFLTAPTGVHVAKHLLDTMRVVESWRARSSLRRSHRPLPPWNVTGSPSPGVHACARRVVLRREKILRRIKVELGKTDAEMEHDPALSVANLMRFDPDAEDNGEFDLVMQQVRGGEAVVWVLLA